MKAQEDECQQQERQHQEATLPTLLETTRRIREDQPSMGVKKLTREIQRLYPALCATAKSVREALASSKAPTASSPPTQAGINAPGDAIAAEEPLLVQAAHCKARGNAAFQVGELAKARQEYAAGVQNLQFTVFGDGDALKRVEQHPGGLATCFSNGRYGARPLDSAPAEYCGLCAELLANLSVTLIKQGETDAGCNFLDALAAAESAVSCNRTWGKAWFRNAQAIISHVNSAPGGASLDLIEGACVCLSQAQRLDS